MAEELTRSLTMLAERGKARGADAVLEDARRAVTPQPVPRAKSRGGLVWAAGAAAIVMVFIGLVVWLLHPFGGADQSPVITQPEAPVVIDSSAISWQSAPLPRELIDIQVLDGSYLAISTHSGPDGTSSEAVVSTNGLNWTPLPSQPTWAGEFSAAQIERNGIGYPVAFVEHGGEVWTVTAVGSQAMPVVERLSEPAGAWTPVAVEAGPGLIRNEVVFAVGGAGAIMFAGSNEGEALLWVLGDNGFELVDDPLINALPVADAAVPWTDATLAGYLRSTRLFATSRGFWAEFWIANDQGVTTDSSLRYRSNDGQTWTEDNRSRTWNYGSVAEFNGRILGVDWSKGGAWISDDDGTTWTQSQTSDQLWTEMVAAGPLGWVVPAGQSGMGYIAQGIWISTDGSTWETVLDLEPRATSIAVGETSIVIAAASGGWDGPATYEVWVGTVTRSP